VKREKEKEKEKERERIVERKEKKLGMKLGVIPNFVSPNRFLLSKLGICPSKR
jgi:hypothetical protein